jgi:DNA-binding LacI/PurR family transcriptional regulator
VPEGSTRRVTSADVARMAGVSRATVSYVLNDTPHQTISADTRDRVLHAAAELGYAPSAAARTLRTGRSDVVLCLLPDWPIGQEVGALLTNLSGALAGHGLTFVAHPWRCSAGRPGAGASSRSRSSGSAVCRPGT